MRSILLSLLFVLSSCAGGDRQPIAGGDRQPVRVGADLLLESHGEFLRGKRIGLVVNHTALLSNGTHLADTLANRDDLTLAALFAPEHGIRGDTTGAVRDTVDAATGIPVYSLYGRTTRPAPETLEGLDVLVFDIQDVGARFYTYVSTLGHVMEAAAARGIPVIVCDRPNLMSGMLVEGPTAEDHLLSFVAFAPIPIVYGMTVGELARMYNGQRWLKDGVRADLRIAPLEGWQRDMGYDETGLRWVPPSPNMPELNTAVVYPGTCLIEGTNLSEGRGTDRPFEIIGAPWLDQDAVLARLASESLAGIEWRATSFTPVRTPGNRGAVKHEGRLCRGIRLIVTDRSVFRPVRSGVALLRAIRAAHPDSLLWRLPAFDRLAGTDELRSMIERQAPIDSIEAAWQPRLATFAALREQYLLYLK